MARVALTTFDNPYNPLNPDQFPSWLLFDEGKGYYSTDYLGRIAATSEAYTDEENEQATEEAIDEIIKYDVLNIYKKVKEPDQQGD